MSEKQDSKKEDSSKDKNTENIDENQENDFIPFLSKDLFDQINLVEEDEKSDKNNDIITDKFTSTLLKDSENRLHDTEEYEDEHLIFEEKELDNFDLNQNNLNNGSIENFHKNVNTQEMDSMPRVSSQPLIKQEMNKSSLISQKRNSALNLGKSNGNNEIYFVNSSNNLQNNLNFINSSFSKNGKSGWICSNCQNFNYESKRKKYFILYKIYSEEKL